MIRVSLFFIVFLTLLGCTANSGTLGESESSPLANVQPDHVEDTLTEGRVHFDVNDVTVNVHLPDQWEYYETAYGLVMTEQISTIATNGELGGLLTHIFVPPLDNLPIRASQTNRALSILREIVSDPDYVGAAKVTKPQSFLWDGHEAAYFLMNNGEVNRTLVLGVILPGINGLIACNISAPSDQSDRIREQLPQLLEGLEINGIILDSESLNQLPDVLPFPDTEGS